MRNAVRTYKLLLRLYPHDYRAVFAAEMLQTSIDHYSDVERCEGRVSMWFWLSTIADEFANIRRQRMTSWTENGVLRATTGKLLLAAAFLILLYPVFLVGVVKTSLALPHPSVSGIGVMVAFGALLVIPGILGLTVSYLLASLVSAFVGIFSGGRAAHTR